MDAGDFVVPVDKPEGPTSHDVVARARKALGTRRIGHTGTLDPFASGLLVLCVGRTTRLAEYLTGLDKTYRAEALLGVETDTLDRDGDVVAESDAWRGLAEEDVRGAFRRLTGTIEQVPPQFSAKKVGGEAMHKKARRGETVELPPASVTVHRLELESMDPPRIGFTVRCSSGTYVRALARDLGTALGCGAHLTRLRRTRVGRLTVDDAVSLEELADPEAVERVRLSPLEALAHFEIVQMEAEAVGRIRHGQKVRVEGVGAAGPETVAVAHGGELVAVAEVEEGVLRPRKVFPE